MNTAYETSTLHSMGIRTCHTALWSATFFPDVIAIKFNLSAFHPYQRQRDDFCLRPALV